MTPIELAQRLNGLQYPLRIPKDLIAQAKESGLVIVFGASDDLMEFTGAFRDEFGCYDGGTAYVHATGLLPSFEDVDTGDKDALRDYFKQETSAVAIHALWGAEPEYSWTYRTDIPHETFEVVDDGKPHCRGIVFSLADVVK